MACDGMCGTCVLDRIRRLLSVALSLPLVVALPYMDMTMLMTLVEFV